MDDHSEWAIIRMPPIPTCVYLMSWFREPADDMISVSWSTSFQRISTTRVEAEGYDGSLFKAC